MEFFRKTNINFIGYRKYTYFLSGLLIVLSLALYIIRWTQQGSPFNLGIEFTGGTALQIKFNKSVSIDRVRDILSGLGYKNAVIQNYGQRKDEILIRLKQYEGNQNEIVNSIKQALLKEYQEGDVEGKIDLNSINDYRELMQIISKYPEFKVDDNDYVSRMNLENEMRSIIEFKENNGGIINSFQEFLKIPGLRSSTIENLKKYFYLSPLVIRNSSMIGPAIGRDLRDKALKAIFFAIIAVLIYISWRFDFRFAVAAVVALIHDVLITSGVFVLTQKEITLSVIAAFLTIFGYSLNDTIVVSDRIRENYRRLHKETFEKVVNRSINETLSRTIVTSLTTLLTVLALYFFGGEVIHNFSFALLIGIVIGTYSSIFVVSPIVLDWYLHSLKQSKR